MKKIILFFLISILTQTLVGQQDYCDFEGNKVITFGACSGTLDSLATNPLLNSTNTSTHCARYVRDTALYDNIKIFPYTKLTDVTPYANSSGSALKITMKIFSTAPAGTIVQLQLGIKSNNTYPAGIHSEYIATTSLRNAWELITFSYFQSPAGSIVTSTNIDKIVILFHPDSHSKDTLYFDDLTGPNLTTAGIAQIEPASFKLSQNYPNPVKDNTHIRLQLNSPGTVSLKLYDMLGNLVSSLVDQHMSTGVYSIPVETENIPDGIYFYVLKKDSATQTMKMVVSK